MGWSAHPNATQAGKHAAQQALGSLGSQQPRLGFIFGSSWFNQPALLHGVRSALADVPLLGGSTAGEITPEGPASHSCVVLLLASEAIACSIGTGEYANIHPREAGQHAGQAALQAFHGSPRMGFLFFGDGLMTGTADVTRGLREALGTSSLVVGGLAGDDLQRSGTYQYADQQVMRRSVVGVLVGGSIKIGVGSEHGFAPISKPRRITRATANILYELDGLPAASVYEEYFGADLMGRLREEGFTRQRIAYPLGIQRNQQQPALLRNVVSFEADGSLACSGEIPEGGWLQLMIGSPERALEAAGAAAQSAVQSLNRIAGVLVFDSVVRRLLLGSRYAALEIARIREAIGPSTVLGGCYTYGEQAPVGPTATYEETAIQTGSVLVIAFGN